MDRRFELDPSALLIMGPETPRTGRSKIATFCVPLHKEATLPYSVQIEPSSLEAHPSQKLQGQALGKARLQTRGLLGYFQLPGLNGSQPLVADDGKNKTGADILGQNTLGYLLTLPSQPACYVANVIIIMIEKRLKRTCCKTIANLQRV